MRGFVAQKIIAIVAFALMLQLAFPQAVAVNISSIINGVGSYIPGITAKAGIGTSSSSQAINSLESECGALYNCNAQLNISNIISEAAHEGNGNISASIIYNSLTANSEFFREKISEAGINASDIAPFLSKNLTAQIDMAINYTPKGYEEINATIKNESGGRYNLTVYWSALGLPSIGSINLSKANGIANGIGVNGTSIQRANYIYDIFVFGENETVRARNASELHITGAIDNGTYTERYVRSNITVLAFGGRYAVEMSNLERNSPTYINISYGSEFRNVTIALNRNYSYSAFEIIYINASNYSCTSQRCWNASISERITPSVAPGHVYSYVYINSTISDSNVSKVTYSFNVSKAWISSHGYNPRYIALYRTTSSSSSWEQLPTTLIGSNSTDYLYSAASPGMSVYAISYSAVTQPQPMPVQKGSYSGVMELAIAIILVITAYYALLGRGRKSKA